ncbi:MAG: transporter substrate-binding domain-containing protein, partial [Tannerella sp.]|nr:transporter substrate-binding domain-containing protein [Tannerella sp.]
LPLLTACNLAKPKEPKEPNHPIYDLAEIKAKDTLTAVTLNTSASYFIYKMQQMGYEYELIEDFAGSLGLKLEIKIAENVTRLEEMLRQGEADILAYPVQMDNTMKNRYLFCGVEQQNHLVIVQRADRSDTIIKDVTQLIGKEVVVKSGSRYHDRLVSLNEELGGGIRIKDVGRDTVTIEDLIEMVASGEISYTVSESNIARLNHTYYSNIDIGLSVSFPQRASWIVRKDCPKLAQAVNDWAANISKGATLKAATKRYFERSKQDDVAADGLIIKKGDISPYDELFRQYSSELGWDWQLLAAIAYQESKFYNHLESWAGAKGLMGIMPNTARGFGFHVDSLDNPELSIQVAIKCLVYFRQLFPDIEDETEKIKFTLASYNAGGGHVVDARNLALEYGKSKDVWDGNVAGFIVLKSEPEYYNNPVCKHGYLRGVETFKYVNEVMERYMFFKSRTKNG